MAMKRVEKLGSVSGNISLSGGKDPKSFVKVVPAVLQHFAELDNTFTT